MSGRHGIRHDDVRQAYAVLGDPRLRAQYDRGEVVGVGAGVYFQAGRAALKFDTSNGASHNRLAQRWQRRWDNRHQGAPLCTGSRPSVRLAILVGLGVSVVASTLFGVGYRQLLSSAADPVSSSAAAPAADTRSPVAVLRAQARTPAAPYVKSGSCYLLTATRQLEPSRPVACGGSHDIEVIKVVDLVRLAGGPVDKTQADHLASATCNTEFTSFTGLSGPTDNIWPTFLTSTGGGIATATCMVDSRYPRASTTRGIAG